MRKFKRVRSLKELGEICRKKRWKLHTQRFDEGSDYVKFDFRIKTLSGQVCGIALFNTVNGRLFGHLSSGEQFSSDNSNHENERWFNILLETAFAEQEEAA